MIQHEKQLIIAKTIDNMNEHVYSCLELKRTATRQTNEIYAARLRSSYEEFSAAEDMASGFKHLKYKWLGMSNQARLNYRLEMLYYFWLSNQEM